MATFCSTACNNDDKPDWQAHLKGLTCGQLSIKGVFSSTSNISLSFGGTRDNGLDGLCP